MPISRRTRALAAGLFAGLAFCTVLQAAAKPFPIPNARHGQGVLKTVNGVPVMFLNGTPREMGEQHGKLVGKHVARLLEYPKTFLKRIGRENDWPLAAVAGKFMVGRLSPEHRGELQALIKSSGLDADSIIVANTMLELRRMGGCSTLIVEKNKSKTGEVLFGRNFDFPPLDRLDRFGLVTVYQPKGKHAFVSVGYPGLIGVISGMNDAGLCIATLDVYASKDGSPSFDAAGQPMMFTFRRILEECTTVRQAESLLRKAKATTWMNLSVCDENGGVVFELTPKNVVVRRPVAGCVCCTNHFRTAPLCRSKECRRFAKLMKGRRAKTLGIADVAKLLDEVNQGKMTIQTMIFEPAALRLHVALTDPPTSDNALKTLDVGKLLKGK